MQLVLPAVAVLALILAAEATAETEASSDASARAMQRVQIHTGPTPRPMTERQGPRIVETTRMSAEAGTPADAVVVVRGMHRSAEPESSWSAASGGFDLGVIRSLLDSCYANDLAGGGLDWAPELTAGR